LITIFCLQKGGASKSTTCVCTGHLLSTEYNRDTLVIDLDSQASTTMSYGFQKPEDIEFTILDVLNGTCNINDCIYETNFGVDLIPSNKFLSSFVIDSITNQKKYGNPFYVLKDKISMLEKKYTHILIDLPPELGIFAISGMVAADNIVIPVQTEFRSLRGLEILMETIESVKENHNPNLEILGILPTMYNASTNLSLTILQDIRKNFLDKVRIFDTVIPRVVRLAEADYYYEPPTFRYKNDDKVQSYKNFVKECFIDA
jgi:chromosome partitioning protein